MFDIAYANSSPTQKLDIYWPEEGDGPFPVVVSIHGGAFMGGDKRDIQLTHMLECLKRDYVLVGVNYRMSSEAIFPALIHDVKAAIRWIRANAKYYLFDPQRIATWGGSAGGYLSLMMGVSAWDLLPKGLAWVIFKYELEIHQYPLWKDNLTIRTWRCPFQKLYELRKYEIYDDNKNLLIDAKSSWILTRLGTKMPARIDRPRSRWR